MFRYLVKRILLFLPTLFVISLITFWLNHSAPGDPVEACMPDVEGNYELTEKTYKRVAHKYGYDLPVFYFSFTAAAYPDTLHRIPSRFKRETLKKLIGQYGNWPQIQAYSKQLRNVERDISYLPDSLDRDIVINLRRTAQLLPLEYKDVILSAQLDKLEKEARKDIAVFQFIGEPLAKLRTAYQQIKEETTRGQLYIPSVRWYGSGNQYHRWLSRFIQGDFGVSCANGQSVAERLKTPLFWTLVINLTAIFLAFILAVPLGVFSAVKRNTLIDKVISLGLFILFSLPAFWIATLLIVFFTSPEYGMNWFEGIGLGKLPSDAPFWDRFWETTRHLILPVFCMTYGGLAFLSRQVRGGMLDVMQSDYIRTARAKGVSPRRVIWRHSFRNALFPLITLFAMIFPATIAGAVVIEQIFNIPGMGREVVESIYRKDWNVVYTILMLSAVLTLIGNLIADILYVIADPRVNFKNR